MKLPRRPETASRRSCTVISFVPRRRNNSHNKVGISLNQEEIRKQMLVAVVFDPEKTEIPIKKHQMITAVVTLVLIAVAATTLPPSAPSAHLPIAPASTMWLKELAIDVNKLPIEDFDDQSLVYSTRNKH